VDVVAFYDKLLTSLASDGFRNGDWQLIPPQPAWAGNPTWQDFMSYGWQAEDGVRYVVVVNYSDHQGQCRLRLPFADLTDRQFRLADVMGSEVYAREGNGLSSPGLYIDLGAWCSNVFRVEPLGM
jgi:hypothetical protein